MQNNNYICTVIYTDGQMKRGSYRNQQVKLLSLVEKVQAGVLVWHPAYLFFEKLEIKLLKI